MKNENDEYGQILEAILVGLHCTLNMLHDLEQKVTFPGYKDSSTEWREKHRVLMQNSQYAMHLLDSAWNTLRPGDPPAETPQLGGPLVELPTEEAVADETVGVDGDQE